MRRGLFSRLGIPGMASSVSFPVDRAAELAREMSISGSVAVALPSVLDAAAAKSNRSVEEIIDLCYSNPGVRDYLRQICIQVS